MTKKALIKTAELLRMANVAKKFGVVVEQEFDGVIVRVSPFHGADNLSAASEPYRRQSREEEAEAALAQWLTEEDHSPVPKTERKGKGGYPIPSGPKDPVQKWYDSLGLDPHTMNEDDMRRLMAKAEDEWIASIPSKKLLKTEVSSLMQLKEYGVGNPVPWQKIKGCGAVTEERLKARGFIEFQMQTKFPDRVQAYILTEAGHEAARKLFRES